MLPLRLLDQAQVESLHHSFDVHLGKEKSGGVGRQLGDAIDGITARCCPPAFNDDRPVAGVDSGDETLARELGQEVTRRRGADDDARSPGIEPVARGVDGSNTTAHPAGRAAHHLTDDGGVGALAQRRIEVDHGDLARDAELLQAREGIAAIEHQLTSATKLHLRDRS
jgi:hypothetical protein